MDEAIIEAHARPVKYWHTIDDKRIQCDMCPRFCKLREGQRGLCFVRGRWHDQMVLTSYGRSSGFCIDPIEKKPLNQFYPGSSVLSFGTAGCNLACKFCQNWDMSKSREVDTLADAASPERLAQVAKHHECKSIAFTYNDPVIFHEYAIDVAQACHEQGIMSVAVTAGYVCAEPRRQFYQYMDAANVDLKAFTERFYRKIAGGDLHTVLDTLQYIRHETKVWLEITTLLIPDENDSTRELEELSQWIGQHLGDTIPLHFSAFHPDWKMLSTPRTPESTLKKARQIAIANGLKHVYTGNIHDTEGDTTYCSQCHTPLIVRDWYQLEAYQLTPDALCPKCGTICAGHFDEKPGIWGQRRQRVRIGDASV